MSSKKPADLSAGIKQYIEFQQMDPKTVICHPNLKIPTEVYHGGSAEAIFYVSNKWEGKTNYYKHRHKYGLNIYFTDKDLGKKISVPYNIHSWNTIVRLGSLRGPRSGEIPEDLDLLEKDDEELSISSSSGVGLIYTDLKGHQVNMMTRPPYPKLYCIPSGRALLIIDNNKVEAVLWGGSLDVTKRGIVG